VSEGGPAIDVQTEPWHSRYFDHNLERERVERLVMRLQESLDQDRTVLTKVVQRETRTTGDERPRSILYRKEHVKLTIEVEWDEWHLVDD
jgi:hypothetical protein